jgi:hypothetical protein
MPPSGDIPKTLLTIALKCDIIPRHKAQDPNYRIMFNRCNIDRWGVSNPSVICSWVRYLWKHWSSDADASSTNYIVMFRCTSSAAPDPPLGFSDHSPELNGHAGACPVGLLQRYVGRSSDVPDASPSVGAACSCTADFNLIRSAPIILSLRHLFACIGCVSRSAIAAKWPCWCIMFYMGELRGTLDHSFASQMCLVDLPCVLLVPITWWCHLSSFPRLVVGCFQWLVFRSGMVYTGESYVCAVAANFSPVAQNFPCFSFRFPLPDCCFLV